MICSHCHNEIADDSMFCTACGAKVEAPAAPLTGGSAARVCPHCGNDIPADAEFCTMCGARLEAAGVAAPVVEGEPDLTAAIEPEPEPVSDPVCRNCRAPLEDGAEFCTNCGSKVKPEVQIPLPDAGAETRALTFEQPDVDAEQYRADVAAAHESLNTVTTDFGVSSSAPVDKTALMPKPVPASGEGGGPVSPESLADKARAGANAPKKKDPRKIAAIVAGVIVAIAVAGGGTWAFINYQHQQQEAAEQAQREKDEAIAKAEHVVVIKVSGNGWDTSAGASRLPVHVEGTDSRGEKVDEVQYATSDGRGINLRQGNYVLSVPASPIAADGTVFSISNTQVEVSFTTKDEEGSEIDATGRGGFELTPIDALDVTDEQINKAYEYASKDTADGAPDADALKAAATKRRDDAVAAKKEADAKAARTITTADYTLELPSYWDGRVTVKYEGDSVVVYSKNYPKRAICSILVDTQGAGPMGDIGTSQMGYVSLSNGRYAHVWCDRYSYVIAYANITNSENPDDYFTYDEARELVDLQTGGAVYYDDVLAAMKDNDTDRADDLVFSQDTFFQNNVVSQIKAK